MKTSIGGKSVAKAEVAREPERAWTAGGRPEGDVDYRSGEITQSFSNDFENITVHVHESDIRKIIAEVEATSWRLRETIRDREFAATHRLGQMRRLLIFEKQKTWKRKVGFNLIETATEMDAQRFRTSLVSEPFYSKMGNLRCPHNPDEFTIEMRVAVERLKMEIILSQPAPSQCDPLPRRLPAAETGSEEPRTPQRSPAIGTGSDTTGVSRVETITEEEGVLRLETSMNVFLHSNITSPEQVCILFELDVGIDDNDEATTSKVQAGAREEFARLPTGRQQRETASTEQSKQFDPGG